MTVPPDLDRRFRERAAREGLIDVAYEIRDTPIGELLVAATSRGVCTVSFWDDSDETLQRLARTHGGRALRLAGPVEAALRQLGEYFAGTRRGFDLELDLAGLSHFQRAVLSRLARIPYGTTATYGQLAAQIGHRAAARAVGGALNRNPLPVVLPCHRIVGSSGRLVGYAGGLDRKRWLLELEGVSLPVDRDAHAQSRGS